jgi:type VI secretion system secreted protein Hcp
VLANVPLSSSRKSFGGSGLLVEQFTLHFSKITERYTQQKIGGGAGGNTGGGWDLAENKAAV